MSTDAESPQINARAAGIVIALGAIASIVAVALDSSASGKDALSIMQGMIAIQPSHQLVHVIAMACLGGLTYGYVAFSQRLGLHKGPVMAGLVAYCLGSVLMLFATVIDGFISTDTALAFVDKAPEVMNTGFSIIRVLSGVMLVDLAKVAWVFQSVAVLFWACALLRERGGDKALGVVGMIAGALPAVIVVAYGSRMTDLVVVGILLLQAVWNLSAAALLVVGSGKTKEHPAQRLASAY